ncbi:hypothetical protein ACQU0X_31750 [Pseudovibrio ascidiaceicola]|uniref:hypothetical protein n=1 Tax=Pseudovibrio ascidiaceicola TaxID=285279 RepID=UPI003D360476
MSKITGPFIEYECSKCGALVQEKVMPDRQKIKERIDEAKTNPARRVCAVCH